MSSIRAVRHIARDLLLGLITVVQATWCRIQFPESRERPRSASLTPGPVLIIRCEAKIGDNLLAIPFLRAVRQLFPGRSIHLLHHAAARPIYARCPYIDHRIEIDWSMSAPKTVWRRISLAAAVIGPHVRQTSYALALAPRWDEDLYAPFLARISGASHAIGFSRHTLRAKARRNLGTDSLLSRVVIETTVAHESIRPFLLLRDHLDALPTVPQPLEYWYGDADWAPSANPILYAPQENVQWVAIAPGAAVGRRKWPLFKFAEALSRLDRSGTFRFAFFGSPSEAAECQVLASAFPEDRCLMLAGRLSIAECAAALARCHLFVGNDSGLMHLAAAVGTSVLAISCHPAQAPDWHANAPARFGPIGRRCVVLQPDTPLTPECHQGCESSIAHCITGVGVDRVVAAAEQLLAEGTEPQSFGSSPIEVAR